MLRRCLPLLAAVLLAHAAETPTKHAFLMLGGATQILDADGKVTWKYPAETRDGCILPNGNILLALQKSEAYPGGAVVEVTRDLKVVFAYKGTQAEVNTAQRLPDGRTLLTEAGDKPRLLEVDAAGQIKVEIPLQCSAKNPHLQSRMARKLADGHYLVPQDRLVRELDATGKVVWEYQAPASKLDNRTFCALRNAAGHTLISLTIGNQIVEVDGAGKVVWELKQGELTDAPLTRTTALTWLPNGNIVFSNYDARAPRPKLIEITRDKKVVWTYVDGTKFGVHEFQLLDAEGKPLAEALR